MTCSNLTRIVDTDVDAEDTEEDDMLAICAANEVTNEMSNLYLSNSEEEEDNESDLEIDNDLEAIKESECLESTHVEEEENNVDEQEWVDANDNDELLMTETNRGQRYRVQRLLLYHR